MLNMDINPGKRTWGFIALLTVCLGFVTFAVSGWTARDFKRVVHVSYVSNPTEKTVENLYWGNPPGVPGEVTVKMTGKVHDGYLELRIRREQGEETRIIPIDHVYDLVFFDPH